MSLKRGWLFVVPFVVLGLISLFVAPELHNALLALGFGLGHIVFGTFIAHRHGG